MNIQEQQQVIERIEKKTIRENHCCADPHVYEQDIKITGKVSYYEIDLRLTAQGIQDKIDEQVKINLELLQRVIEKQVSTDFHKGEQQIRDYINRFQVQFDYLLTERVKREGESHEIIAILKS